MTVFAFVVLAVLAWTARSVHRMDHLARWRRLLPAVLLAVGVAVAVGCHDTAPRAAGWTATALALGGWAVGLHARRTAGRPAAAPGTSAPSRA
ncbi:hypothetical protein [Kitasatospora paranensis]|uniref:Uncharacterized protein n=1 Tax=Kitasatospora paranensis TaxID=258053 RepID=A0ABW2G3H4_9ACTN